MRGFSDTCGNPEIGSIKRIMALTPIGRRHIWMWCVPPICKRHVLLLVSEEKLPLNTKKPGAGPGSKRHTVCDYMTIVVNLPWRVWRRGESAPRRNAAVVFLLVNILASSVAWMTQQTQALINGKLLFFLLMYSSTESTWEQSFLYYFPHCSIWTCELNNLQNSLCIWTKMMGMQMKILHLLYYKLLGFIFFIMDGDCNST